MHPVLSAIYDIGLSVFLSPPPDRLENFWANKTAIRTFVESGKPEGFQFSNDTLPEVLTHLMYGYETPQPKAWLAFLEGLSPGIGLRRLEFDRPDNQFNLITVWQDPKIGSLVFISDTSDMKHLRNQQEKSKKLQAIGRLAANYAHDFNNYLAIIDRQLELLSLNAKEDDLALVKRAQETTRAAADRSHELLTFSQPRAKRKNSILVSDIIERLKTGTAYIQSGQMTIDFPTEIEANLSCDPVYLHSAMINLIVNACDACQRQGSVQISFKWPDRGILERYFPERDPRLDWVQISVKDTGHGIDPDIRNHVFDPFFTTKGDKGGSGLGLSIVSNLIRDSNGVIFLEDTSSAGTTISMFLPGEFKLPKQNVKSVPAVSKPNQEHILLVEDEYYLAESTRNLLTKIGFLVTVARCYSEAKDQLDKHGSQFDGILSDVILPDGNGIELCSYSKAMLPKTPVILVSGNIPEVLSQPFIACGADRVLAKPAPIATLSKALLDCIHQTGQTADQLATETAATTSSTRA
ncbi:MAG: ATP-binding protein [Pseudoruegeria sp.]